MGGAASSDLRKSDSSELCVNIALIGDSYSGKTTLCERFLGRPLPTKCRYVGCEETHIEIADYSVHLKLFDLRGWETLRGFNERFLRNVDMDGIILVYDVSRSSNLDNVLHWIDFLRRIGSKARILLVGNKIDYDYYDRKISRDYVESFAWEQNVEFIECSAKRGVNVKEAFELLLNRIALDKIFKDYNANNNSRELEENDYDFLSEIDAPSFEWSYEEIRRMDAEDICTSTQPLVEKLSDCICSNCVNKLCLQCKNNLSARLKENYSKWREPSYEEINFRGNMVT